MKPRIKWDAARGKWKLTYGRTLMEQRVKRFSCWPLAVTEALGSDVQSYQMEPCS